jgi:hypothetical protein
MISPNYKTSIIRLSLARDIASMLKYLAEEFQTIRLFEMLGEIRS